MPGLVLGTVGYISPEQVRARCGSPVGRAVGAILYELLSGRRAFEGVTTADTLTVILVTKV